MLANPECVSRLIAAGISHDDAIALRRIAMSLHRWHELECGTNTGAIERELPLAVERAAWPGKERWWDGAKWSVISQRRTYERDEKESVSATLPRDATWRETGTKPYWTWNAGQNGQRIRSQTPDRETGAKRRLARILARYPGFTAYVQGDPRGAALYVLRPGDVRDGEAVDSVYNRGIAVYR